MLDTIMQEINAVLNQVDGELIGAFSQRIRQRTGRIFVVGEGRSGLMAKAFAMRLMHLGVEVYVVGETITPSIQVADTLVAISGSGKTAGVVHSAMKSSQLGCSVVAVTTDAQSSLAQVADFLVMIPAATKFRKEGEAFSIQPLSSLFDQSVHIVFDAVCLELAQIAESDAESNGEERDTAFRRHSNLE